MDTHSTPSAPPSPGPADFPSDPLKQVLAAARERGHDAAERIIAGPEMLTSQPFGVLARMRRPTLDRARRLNQVLAVRSELSGWRFPAWQLAEGGKPYPAIPKLLDILGSHWTVYRFMLQSHPELGGSTGLEAVRSGRERDVLDAAESSLSAFA